MLGSDTFGIDLIGELQLRQWARSNYVSEDIRSTDWHPVILDEMRRRDEELFETGGRFHVATGSVELATAL